VASVIPSAPLGTDAAAGPLGLGAAAGAAPHGAAAAERRFRFELAAHPGSPAQARRLARARLTGWSVCEDICDTAALVISELVTNAIVHTASSLIVCELHDGDDLVRIAVRDEGCAPGEPHPSPARPEEEHGRGLLLIDGLCHAWGAQEHGLGLLVWAELPRKADSPRHDCGPCNDLGWGARPKPGPADGPDEEGEPEGHHTLPFDENGIGNGNSADVRAPSPDGRVGTADDASGPAPDGLTPGSGDMRTTHQAGVGAQPSDERSEGSGSAGVTPRLDGRAGGPGDVGVPRLDAGSGEPGDVRAVSLGGQARESWGVGAPRVGGQVAGSWGVRAPRAGGPAQESWGVGAPRVGGSGDVGVPPSDGSGRDRGHE